MSIYLFAINFLEEISLCILLFAKPPYFQEIESSKTKDPWCISTLKRLKEASPLSLKVSLKSVWRLSLSCFFLYSCFIFPLNFWRSKLILSSFPLFFAEESLIFISFLFPTQLTIIIEFVQIREGRYQTLDQCLIREYRMSLQGISKQISSDFCEV